MWVCISPEEELKNELSTVCWILENTSARIHIRKPDWPLEKIVKYLKGLPKDVLPRISVHGNCLEAKEDFDAVGRHFKSYELVKTEADNRVYSKSFHSFSGLDLEALDYAFIGPVYQSISKAKYPQAWTQQELEKHLEQIGPQKSKLIALGGIGSENAKKLLKMGFGGFAVLGSIWMQKSEEQRKEEAKKLEAICQMY
ncbi:MAG: thiamine phosphate synthase [Luteibaculum sp.]